MNQLSNTRNSPKQNHSPPAKLRIAIICARWHSEIVDVARDACVARLKREGVSATSISHFTVPGAFEIPLFAQRLARLGDFEAIIACGLVADGGIYRHEFVASAVIDGLMRVQLDCDVPIFSAVLTPHHFHETVEHEEFFKAHFLKKGEEVAGACVEMITALREVA